MSGGAVLITGAAGFIGSHLAEALLRQGRDVVGLDNFDAFYARNIKQRNLDAIQEATASIAGAGAFTLVEGDIRRPGDMMQLFASVEPVSVIHLAARAGVRPSIAQPGLYAEVNVTGTVNLLEAARKTKSVDRFVMASSSSVYGNRSQVPFCEADPVSEPISPYAATKRACELIGHTYHHLYGLPVACLRFFTVFGPRQRPDLAIARFIELMERNESIPMFGDGSTSRDYTYIDDIIAGVIAAHDRIVGHGYRIWNLGGRHPVTLHEMIQAIGSAVGKAPRIEQLAMQPGDVERTCADTQRSAKELGFAPQVPFAEGVARQVAVARADREAASAI
ncbi:MAG: GDP-mannose 4,6-dehydratase [Phycisphaerales bacterium]|nr:GDP-mannose 4,6-dehydratase [Phycisphaerales bacterium]